MVSVPVLLQQISPFLSEKCESPLWLIKYHYLELPLSGDKMHQFSLFDSWLPISDGSFPKSQSVNSPSFSDGKMICLMRQDSFFEYLLKGYILFKDLELLDIQRCFYWWCWFLTWRFGLKMYIVSKAWRKTWGPSLGPKGAKLSWQLGSLAVFSSVGPPCCLKPHGPGQPSTEGLHNTDRFDSFHRCKALRG